MSAPLSAVAAIRVQWTSAPTLGGKVSNALNSLAGVKDTSDDFYRYASHELEVTGPASGIYTPTQKGWYIPDMSASGHLRDTPAARDAVAGLTDAVAGLRRIAPDASPVKAGWEPGLVQVGVKPQGAAAETTWTYRLGDTLPGGIQDVLVAARGVTRHME